MKRSSRNNANIWYCYAKPEHEQNEKTEEKEKVFNSIQRGKKSNVTSENQDSVADDGNGDIDLSIYSFSWIRDNSQQLFS